METEIKKCLLMRGTLYRDIGADVLSSLSSVAETYSLDPKTLASKLDRFMTVSRPDCKDVSIEDVEAFGKEQSTSAAKVAKNVFARPSWEDVDMAEAIEAANPTANNNNNKRKISPYLTTVVSAPLQQPKPHTPSGPGQFKERCANGAVHSILNEHIPAAENKDVDCKIEILGDAVSQEARFMVDRLSDKAAYIDHRISTFEKEIEAAVEGGVHNVATAAQNQSWFVGRVCCDTEDGKLNPQSVLLEGSTAVSNGARIKVDLSNCKDFRLYPGQIACIKGTNPSGFCVVASEVLPGLPLKAAETSNEVTELSCMIAAGPFTTNENLDYEPLAALLEAAAVSKPAFLMLVGPFLDADHPNVRDGSLEETFDQIFESRIAAQLAAFSEKVGGATRILLLSSHKDVHHDLTFPQGPLPNDLTLDEKITNLPNPCTLKCNDVVLGCSSVDWLMACTKEEISQSAKPVDRLPALASHIVNQRSYLPLFPPPLGLPLDTARGYGLELPCTPHILVSPSDLAPFAKIITVQQPNLAENEQNNGEMNVVVINPGRLTKGATAGTYVEMRVAGDTMEVEGAGVDARCRVEVKRL